MVGEIKWYEDRLKMALEEFKKDLKEDKTFKSDETKTILQELKERRELVNIINEKLKDNEKIAKLEIEEMKEIFRLILGWKKKSLNLWPEMRRYLDSDYLKKKQCELREFFKKIVQYGINHNEKDELPTIEGFRVASASQLLTFRYPDKFYTVSLPAEQGIKELLDEKEINKVPSKSDPKDYPKWRPIFEYLRVRINEIYKELRDEVPKEYQDLFNREADFLDVNLFLWWLFERNYAGQL